MSRLAFPVAEIFGPTLQGEGPLAGRISTFVRFGGCDYRCSRCDSLHAVDRPVGGWPKMTTSEILDVVVKSGAGWLVLTGGNPALFDLEPLVRRVREARVRVSIETQGTVAPDWLMFVDSVVLSPKAPGMGIPVDLSLSSFDRFLHVSQNLFSTPYVKVVCFDDDDLLFAQQAFALARRYHRQAGLGISVGTFPGIETAEDRLRRFRWIAERMTADPSTWRDVQVLPQLHVLIWGEEKGR